MVYCPMLTSAHVVFPVRLLSCLTSVVRKSDFVCVGKVMVSSFWRLRKLARLMPANPTFAAVPHRAIVDVDINAVPVIVLEPTFVRTRSRLVNWEFRTGFANRLLALRNRVGHANRFFTSITSIPRKHATGMLKQKSADLGTKFGVLLWLPIRRLIITHFAGFNGVIK